MKVDPRVDAYIAKSRSFAQPILRQIRAGIHERCPECEEAIKWGMPFFTYHGVNLAHMAAFKAHASLGFWDQGGNRDNEGAPNQGMGMFGKLTCLADLPLPEEIDALIHAGMARIDAAPRARRKTAPRPRAIQSETPMALAVALAQNAAARATYDAFPPGARRDYDLWIAEAKQDETRAKRVTQAVEWLADGKKRHWRYGG